MDSSIKKKMQLSFIVISIIPLLILGSYSYRKTVQIIGFFAYKYALVLIQELEQSVTKEFTDIDDMSKIIVDNRFISNVLAMDGESYSADSQYLKAHIKMSLMPFIINNPYIQDIYILSENYDEIFSASNDLESLSRNILRDGITDYHEHDIYLETKKGFSNSRWWTTDPGHEFSGFILSRKLFDSRQGFLGVLLIIIKNDVITRGESLPNDFMGGDLFLLDQNNKILYEKKGENIGRIWDLWDMDREDFSTPKGSFLVTDGRGAKQMVVYNLFQASDWKVLLQIPYRQLIREVDSLRYFIIGIILFMIFLTVIIAMKFSSSIYNPLKKLMGLMERASLGEISVRFPVVHHDDIGRLGQSFNQLMIDMEVLIDKVKDEQDEKARLHIQMLEYQMNPHFLYNTFATMYWSAMDGGNYKLAELSNSLSQFFKLSLNNGEELTTVRNEVSHVEEYLKIQRQRSDDDFEFEIIVEEGLEKMETIKILLQPLVENSIIHGFWDLKRDGKRVEVSVYQRQDRLIYRVEDNGKGIDREIGEVKRFESAGFSLNNIVKRLNLYYGEDFSFTCNSSPGGGCVFEISIPIKDLY